MSSIDQRIVEMVFDNKQFEQGVSTTMNSIDQLDKSLQFSGVGNSLNSLGDSVSTISERFSSMGVIATTALMNITNKAVDAGVALVKSLTVDQLTDGFKKYEASVSNIKAIMNQSGKDMETVNNYVDQLSWYSDQTSFSFDSMTSALKSFTQQGIDLDKAIPMIMGIGNAVTYTGVSAKEGSAAFEYYAKAISAGYMTNKEWISISRTLGAASVGLKQQFMDAAVAAKTLQKRADGTYVTTNGLAVSIENFDSTLGNLKGKWLTTEVMMKVLGGEYGNVSVQLKELMDQYEEETGKILTLTEATEMFADQLDATAVKYALSATEAKTFTEAIDATKDAVSTQFKVIFDSVFGNTEEAIKLWSDLNSYLVDTFATPFANAAKLAQEWKKVGGRDDIINAFWNITEALGNVGDAIKSAWHSIFPAKGVASIKAFTERIEKFTEKLKENETFVIRLKNILIGLFSAFNIVKKTIKAVAAGLEPLITFAKGELGLLSDKIGDIAAKLFSFSTKNIGNNFKSITESVAKFSEKVIDFYNNLYVFYYEGGTGFAGILNSIFGSIINIIGDFLKFIGRITGWDMSWVDDSLVPALVRFNNKINDIVYTIQQSGFVQSIKGFFTSFSNKKDEAGLENKVKLMDRFRIAVEKVKEFLAPLTDAVKTFFSTFWEKVKEGFSGMTINDLFSALGGAAIGASAFSIFTLVEKLKSKLNSIGSLKKIGNSISSFIGQIKNALGLGGAAGFAQSMKTFATALLIFAAALFVIASIDAGALIKSGMAATTILAEFVGLVKILGSGGKVKGITKIASALLLISGAVLIMAAAMKVIAGISTSDVTKGLLAIGAIMLEMAAFTKIVGGTKKMKSIGTGMILVAASMLIFAKSIEALGSIDARVMSQGLSSMAIVLGELAAAMLLLPKDTMGKAAGLLIVAGALSIIGLVIGKLGELEPSVLAKGLITIGVALAEFAIALNFMKGTLGASAALLVAAVALAVLAPVIKMLGNMELNQIVSALVALAGVFTVLGMAGMALTPAIGTIMLLGVAMGLIGVGIAALAIGLTTLAINIEIIAASIPVMLSAINAAIGMFIRSLAERAASVIDAVVIIITAVLDALIQCIPKFGELVITLIGTICDVVLETIPKIVETVLAVIVAVIEGLAKYTPKIIDALGKLFASIFKYFNGRLPEWKERGVEMLTKLKDGIVSKVKTVVTEVKSMVSKVLQAIKDKFNDLKQAGKDAVQGFIDGFKEKISSAVTWAKNLGSSIVSGLKGVLGINSPSKVFAEIGKYSVKGLSNGLEKYSRVAEKSAAGVGENVTDALSNSFNNINGLLDDNLNPQIKPVLDLSEIQNGSKYLDTAFGNRTINATLRGRMSDYESQQILSSELSKLRDDVYDAMSGVSISSEELGSAVRSALSDMGIYMDSSKVGKLVTNYQSNTRRATGAAY